jgi:5-hydroxyisourate hydrolase-like protein (transthyretin family)
MKAHKYIFRNSLITIISAIIIFQYSAAQNTTASKEKLSTSIQLAFLKTADNTKHITVKVSAKTKENKREPAKNAHINFYIQNKEGQKNIGKSETNADGKADFVLPKNLPADTGLSYHIVAKIEGDDAFENSDEEIRFKDVTLTLKLNPSDTNKSVTATLTMIGEGGKETHIKDVPIKFYIQRMFGIMPAAEDNSLNSDETGMATMNYPKEVSGGKDGNINVIARVEDNELFGTVEASSAIAWGKIVPAEVNPFPRALWEPYAPPSLVMVICILFGGVWTTYFYIFYHMYKIKKDKSERQQELEEIINQ